MNDTATSAPGASLLPSSTDAFTAAHLAIIAILIVLTLVAILYGMKLARRRHRAEHAIEEHNAAVEAAPPAPPAPAPPTPAPPTPAIDQRSAVPVPPPPSTDGPAAGAPGQDASAPPPAAAASQSQRSAVPAASGGSVTQLKGLGPKVTARLGELGITTVGQLAALDDAAAARLDDDLGPFRGRMARDRWLDQARLLAAGDTAGFEAAFGKL